MNDLSKLQIVTRSDLIGNYLNQTAATTRDLLNKCSNRVIFIDETYSFHIWTLIFT